MNIIENSATVAQRRQVTRKTRADMKRYLIIIKLALIGVIPALAQSAQRVSPEIHPDRTVTFQFGAPNATNVLLALEASAAQQMKKDEHGVWTVTIGPLAPNIYGYSFLMDGIRMPDVASAATKPEPRAVSTMFEVQSDRPQIFDFDPTVPHGTVHLHDYDSKSLGKLRRMRVYTPAGYEQNSRTRYPVLVLLHGGFDTEATWTEYGRAHFILDHLIAWKKAKPMIVVMVNGFAERNAGEAKPEQRPGTGTAFEDDLLEDVIPFVEKNYRIKPGRENRAITGLSMGGGQSLTIGLTRPERFAWIGGMSASVSKPELVLAGLINDPKAANRQLKLLWFSCGKSDGVIRPNQALDKTLTEHGVRHTFVPMEGGHEWLVWRRGLEEFLPLVFTERR